jgi:hypothetical protein
LLSLQRGAVSTQPAELQTLGVTKVANVSRQFSAHKPTISFENRSLSGRNTFTLQALPTSSPFDYKKFSKDTPTTRWARCVLINGFLPK